MVCFFWTIFFISAFSEMVLAMTFSTWYWSNDVPFFVLPQGVYRTFRYHMGTVAFGALVLNICRLLRLVLQFLDVNLKKCDNALARTMLRSLKCLFWCNEIFLRYLNNNAFIMCAIYGKNLGDSAKDAFYLLMRNFSRFLALDHVSLIKKNL